MSVRCEEGNLCKMRKRNRTMGKWRKVKKKEQGSLKSPPAARVSALCFDFHTVSFLTHTFKPHHTQGFILLLN